MTFGYCHIFLREIICYFLIISGVKVEPFILIVFKRQLRSEPVLHVCWLATSVLFFLSGRCRCDWKWNGILWVPTLALLNREHSLVTLGLLWRKGKIITLSISFSLRCFIRCIALNWQAGTHVLGMSGISVISIGCTSRHPFLQVGWHLVILSLYILYPDPTIPVLSAECFCPQWWVASDFVV